MQHSAALPAYDVALSALKEGDKGRVTRTHFRRCRSTAVAGTWLGDIPDHDLERGSAELF